MAAFNTIAFVSFLDFNELFSAVALRVLINDGLTDWLTDKGDEVTD